MHLNSLGCVNQDGSTALHYAAYSGHEEVVGRLIDMNANVDAVDKSGNTALHDAAFQGHKAVVDQLLGSGANRRALNQDGCSALDLARGTAINSLLSGHGIVNY